MSKRIRKISDIINKIENKHDAELLTKYINVINNTIDILEERVYKTIDILNNYTHYSLPDEEQSMTNEQLVLDALQMLEDETSPIQWDTIKDKIEGGKDE